MFYLCVLKRSKSNNIQKAHRMPSTQVWVCNYHLPIKKKKKKLEFLEEIAEYISMAEKTQIRLMYFVMHAAFKD